MNKAKAVVVTTAHRGVFFGYVEADEGSTITLVHARNCIYWERSIGGFLGLAEGGPNEACRIGATAKRITLRDVTSVTDCTPEAEKAWTEHSTWK